MGSPNHQAGLGGGPAFPAAYQKTSGTLFRRFSYALLLLAAEALDAAQQLKLANVACVGEGGAGEE